MPVVGIVDYNPTPNLDVIWIRILQPQSNGSLIHTVYGGTDGRARLRRMVGGEFFFLCFLQRCLELVRDLSCPLLLGVSNISEKQSLNLVAKPTQNKHLGTYP